MSNFEQTATAEERMRILGRVARGLPEVAVRDPINKTMRDVHPRPGTAVIPGVQEHPFAVKAEAEMASMFEEVAADDAAMS